MERKKLKIGLFGFGCVGQGLYEVLQATPKINAEVKKICVKNRDKFRILEKERFTFDKNDLLNDPEINLIVELIDDAEAAFEIVSAAMKAGKSVVSANKKMISEHFEELLVLKEETGVSLLYEAACCASIPVIRNLEEYYDNDLLHSIEGIVNGSTNYILTKTAQQGVSFESALKEAQKNGFAESDPSLDTGGYDARFKLQILLAHAFGVLVKPGELFRTGIDRLGELELTYAREKVFKIKLVASARRNKEGRIEAFVAPRFVRNDDPLFCVDDVYNGIKIKSAFSDTQFFSGKGAGAHPTASAVLSDISALSYGYQYEYKKLQGEEILEERENIYIKILLRHANGYGEALLNTFTSVEENFAGKHEGYIKGVISLEKLGYIYENKAISFVVFEQVDLPEQVFDSQEPEIELREAYI